MQHGIFATRLACRNKNLDPTEATNHTEIVCPLFFRLVYSLIFLFTKTYPQDLKLKRSETPWRTPWRNLTTSSCSPPFSARVLLIFLIITNYMYNGKYQLSKSRWNLDYLLILCPTSGQSAMGIKKIQYVAILNWQL